MGAYKYDKDKDIREHTAIANLRVKPLYRGGTRGKLMEPEHEGIRPANYCFGDISSWARGISKPFGTVFKPKRPLCDGKLERIIDPEDIGPDTVYGPFLPPEAPVVTATCLTKFDEVEHAVKQNKAVMAITARFERLYRGKVRKRGGKPVEGPVTPKVRKASAGREAIPLGKGRFKSIHGDLLRLGLDGRPLPDQTARMKEVDARWK